MTRIRVRFRGRLTGRGGERGTDRRDGRLRRRGREDDREVLTCGRVFAAGLDDVLETAPAQQLRPLVSGEEPSVGAEVGVGGVPETLQDAEHRRPQSVVVELGGQEVSAGGEEGRHPGHRHRHVAGGVQGVGGKDDVVAADGESLIRGVGVQVQDAVVDEVVGREVLVRRGEEEGRDVGERVPGALRREEGQQCLGEASRSRPHLEYAQRPVGRPLGHDLLQQRPGHTLAESHVGRGRVELTHQLTGALLGEHLQRVAFRAHKFRETAQLMEDQRHLVRERRQVGHDIAARVRVRKGASGNPVPATGDRLQQVR
ncbi:hypothetical protein NOGI109294_16590 [Nocardiopsis gilva]